VVPFAAGQLMPVKVGEDPVPVPVPEPAVDDGAEQGDGEAKTGWVALLALYRDK
jgi:hypothetical protein